MALADTDIVTAVNGAGVPDEPTLQSMFVILGAFAPVIQAGATAAGITLEQAATAFATRASLQIQVITLQQQIAAAQAAASAADVTANAGISALQSQLAAANAQLQAAVAGT